MGTNELGGRSQIRFGALLSYLLIAVNSLQGVFLAPYVLSQIGEGSYGVYKTIASFSSAIMVLDLGIGSTVMRYTAKYCAADRSDEIENFGAMGLLEAGIMALVIGLVSLGIYGYLPTFYSTSFTQDEIALAQMLFAVLAVNMILVIFENVLNGIITGCNCFVFANGTKLALLLLRILANVALLRLWKSAVLLVLITLVCSVLTMGLQLFYIRGRLKLRLRLRRWDTSVFRESLGYTSLMFIQTLAIQANGNIDNIVISRVIGAAAVTVYSFGIQMFGMYESLAMSFSGLMLPSVSRKIHDGADNAQLQQLVTRVGRMQFLVLGAALAGFACVGRDFIYLWLGEGFEDVYALSLIMMVPVTFTLIQNVCLSILRARNMMKFRTFCLIITALFNGAVTVIGTRLFGYYAAAIGTGLSVLVGSVCIMNIYYHKRIGFRVFRFYGDVFRRLLLCIAVPAVAIALLGRVCEATWLSLALRVGVFLVLYGAMLLAYGMAKEEKEAVFGVVKKRK